MDHYIAYHSATRMGYQLEPSGELNFLSRKLGILKKAVGNTVWVVQGIAAGRKTTYSLCGAYLAEQINLEDTDSNLYSISGRSITEFDPPIQLNELDWFPMLMKSQSNFSLGFNRLNAESVVQALTKLQTTFRETPPLDLPDIDLAISATEGMTRLVSHLRRERNRALIDAKKLATLTAKGKLACEACGFDFAVVYGDIGEKFCEVHHLVPLSASSEAVTTTADDLAVLCSNCHRMIHRTTPMLTVAELSGIIRSRRKEHKEDHE